MRNTIVRTTAALLGVLLLGAAAGADTKSDVDRGFVDLMRAHHRDGVEMARIAERKATMEEVKSFARRTREGQEKDLRELGALRERLFKGQPEADRLTMPDRAMDRGEMKKESERMMERLRTAEGGAFDHDFITLMTKHHEDSVRRGRHAAASGAHGEVRELAGRMERQQTKEIAELRAMERKHAGAPAGDGQASARGR